jgi:single-stranded DNA-binding protein
MRIMDINLVVLAGRLATQPEHRVFESGAHLLRLLITVRSDEPRRRVDVVPVTLWDPPEAPSVGGLAAGDRLWVTGSLQRRFWEAPEGRRSRLEIVAHQVQRAETTEDAVPVSE